MEGISGTLAFSSPVGTKEASPGLTAEQLQERLQSRGSGFLKVKVVSAKGLRAADLNGKSDPYVKVSLQTKAGEKPQEVQTDIKKKTLDPVWNERFYFQTFSKTDDVLVFNLWDWDKLSKHDFLGICSFPVKLLTDYCDTEVSLPITEGRGTLDVVILYVPNTFFGLMVRRCIESGEMFKDKDFIPSQKIIGSPELMKKIQVKGSIQWLRPSQFLKATQKPFLFKGGIEPSDIRQQLLGDCYFLAAVAVLASHPSMVKALFEPNSYSEQGIYKIKLFYRGEWQDVVIDDLIPMKGNDNTLFARSIDMNELWVMFLEKAYAKLHGSYEAIEGRHSIREAFEHLTGGWSDTLNLEPYKQNTKKLYEFFDELVLWRKNKYLMAASTASDEEFDFSTPANPNKMGIVPFHAYSILDIKLVDERHRLLKLRNTWGKTEWLGAWSDRDRKSWTPEIKKKLNYVNSDDGQFWISIDDFVKEFNYFYVCRTPIKDKFATSIRGEWKNDNTTCGGMIQHEETFFNNPQYQIYLPTINEQTSLTTQGGILASAGVDKVRVILSIQLDKEPDENEKANPVGIYVFRNDRDTRRILPGDFSIENKETGAIKLVAQSSMKKCFRDAVEFQLERSKNPYIVVCSRWYPRTEGSFRLDVCSEFKIVLRAIPKEEDWITTVVKGSFDPSAENGAHTQLLTFPSNPKFFIDGIQGETVVNLTVEATNPQAPFYPYVLKKCGIEKMKTKKLLRAPDCALFPPKSIFYQVTFTFKFSLKVEEGPFMLVLATPYAEITSDFTITLRTNLPIKVSKEEQMP